MKFSYERDKLIVLLLIADLAFILLHILFMYTDLITNFIFVIWRDRGPAEFYQYVKYLWVAALLLIIFFVRKKFIFLVYALLFGYFLADDFFEIHETLGASIAKQFSFVMPFGLRRQDLGELMVYAVVGGIFFSLVALFYFNSDLYTKKVSKIMIALVFLLAFFGIILDMISMMFSDAWVSAFFNFLEDAGEMLVMSIITWFVYRLNPSSDLIPIFQEQTSGESVSPSGSVSV